MRALFQLHSGRLWACGTVENRQTISYTWNYESDSGYTDINECVQDIVSSSGKVLQSTIVHDWASFSGQKSFFCADIARIESKAYTVLFDDALGEFGCWAKATTATGGIKQSFASDLFCGIQK